MDTEIVADNIVAWNALAKSVAEIRATLHDPRQCAQHADAAAQNLQVLLLNLGLLATAEKKS